MLGTCIGALMTSKKGYQPRTNIGKDEKGDFVTDLHIILARWKNHFSYLLNLHRVNDVRQTEIHTAGLLVPEPSASEVELATEKLKRYKSPGSDHILAQLIKEGAEQFALISMKLLILFEMSN
jgi:hypothetical protein